MKKIALSVFIVVFFARLNAQEVEPVKNIFKGTRFVNMHSTNLAAKNELQLLVQHRFGDISDGIYNFFGLDLAFMRLGFEYGLTDNFMVGIGRSSYMKTYDSFLKYRFLTQSSSTPLSVTATVAGSVPTIKNGFPKSYNNFSDKVSGDIQFHISKSFETFGFQVSPGYIFTGFIPIEGNNYSFFTAGLGGSVKLSKKVSANIEYLYRFENEISYKNPLSASVDIKTSGHLFQLIATNGQQMFDQAVITGTTGDWTKGSLYLGFNLIRGFNFKQY